MGALTVIPRVLVVDDEQAVADSLCMIMRAKGYAARVAYDGKEAIEVAEYFHPHAVISDVVMSGMNGMELALYFSERHPECKVLLVSGHVMTNELVEESIRHGYTHSVLPKPCHPSEYLDFVATCTPAA